MTQLKALSILQCVEMVERQRGAAALELVKAELSSEARRAIFDSLLVPSDWIDIRYATEVLVVYDRVLGAGDGQAGKALVRDLAIAQTGGIYRVLFAFTSPRALIEKTARLWPRYYDTGESIGAMNGDHAASLRIVGCRDLPRYHEWMIDVFMTHLIERTGASAVVGQHTRCVASGDDSCLSEFRWR
jgi:hypothetical protein